MEMFLYREGSIYWRVFLCIRCHVWTDNFNFTSSFLILMPFISFSCLIALASSIMLNRNGKSRHSYLVPDYNFSLLCMFAVRLAYMAFIMLRNSPSISNLLIVFIMKIYCILSNAFSAYIEMIIWFLYFILLMSCITLICRCWAISFHPSGKSHLLMMNDPFNVLLNLVC